MHNTQNRMKLQFHMNFRNCKQRSTVEKKNCHLTGKRDSLSSLKGLYFKNLNWWSQSKGLTSLTSYTYIYILHIHTFSNMSAHVKTRPCHMYLKAYPSLIPFFELRAHIRTYMHTHACAHTYTHAQKTEKNIQSPGEKILAAFSVFCH